jgi:hypothetical protein
MAWFFYSVVLPLMALSVALAGAVIYWWFKQDQLNGVAIPAKSTNQGDSALAIAASTSGSTSR